MHILNEEHAITKAFLQSPWKKLAYSEVRKISGKKSKSYIYHALSHLIQQKIVQTEQVGKSLLYSLNLKSAKTHAYIGFLSEYLAWCKTHIPNKIIENLVNKISKITPFFVFIVTGSYAKKIQTKKSDLDVTVICDDSINPRAIEAEIDFASRTSTPKVHSFVFKKSEFIQMLINDEQNYGKEVARNNLVFFGADIYFNIISEAVHRGFES